MAYLRKHSFYLIVVFILAIFSNKFLFYDLNIYLQWLLGIIMAINGMIIVIPQTWFWTENRIDYKKYRQIKYWTIVKTHPWRLLLQYFSILIVAVLPLRPFWWQSLILATIVCILMTPVYLDYFTNANIFHTDY